MLDRSLVWFDEQGCGHRFACVEGFNTPSSNLFAKRGFRIMSFMKQVRTFGQTLPRVWIRCVHTFDVGHFLWEQTVDPKPDREAPVHEDTPGNRPHWLTGLAVTILLQSFFGYIMMVR